LALNYYSQYLREAGDSAVNAQYAQERIGKIKGRMNQSQKLGRVGQSVLK